MAPELALEALKELSGPGRVLDPMAGSGTVPRHAIELGRQAIGFDLDPLAVLMAKVWTTPASDAAIERLTNEVLAEASSLRHSDLELNWIDNDPETSKFVRYWFASRQEESLRRLAVVLHRLDTVSGGDAGFGIPNVLRVALSRIIITKDKGASLGRDVSHSRPHKVMETSDYCVFSGFKRSLKTVRQRLLRYPPARSASINVGDARGLYAIQNESVDCVLTSPPYLNAIDYMRGHRFSLVWLGHTLRELRATRSNSIGAERGPNSRRASLSRDSVKGAMGPVERLPNRHQRMIDRYVDDILNMIAEVARVLRSGGRATFVVGNSCLKGEFIRNSDAVLQAATAAGLEVSNCYERELPERHRYLPVSACGTLGKRMRTETIMSFFRA